MNTTLTCRVEQMPQALVVELGLERAAGEKYGISFLEEALVDICMIESTPGTGVMKRNPAEIVVHDNSGGADNYYQRGMTQARHNCLPKGLSEPLIELLPVPG